MARAQRGMAGAGVGSLSPSPGAQLPSRTRDVALPLERWTCLVLPAAGDPRLVVPRLEQPVAEASPAGDLVEIVSHEETDDAYALVADILGPVGRLGLANRMWA